MDNELKEAIEIINFISTADITSWSVIDQLTFAAAILNFSNSCKPLMEKHLKEDVKNPKSTFIMRLGDD